MSFSIFNISYVTYVDYTKMYLNYKMTLFKIILSINKIIKCQEFYDFKSTRIIINSFIFSLSKPNKYNNIIEEMYSLKINLHNLIYIRFSIII